MDATEEVIVNPSRLRNVHSNVLRGFVFCTNLKQLTMKLTCKSCGHTGIPATQKNNIHISAYCMECGCFIKHLPQDKMDGDFILYFGKYKGRAASSLVGSTAEEFNYLCWLRDNGTNLKDYQRQILTTLTK